MHMAKSPAARRSTLCPPTMGRRRPACPLPSTAERWPYSCAYLTGAWCVVDCHCYLGSARLTSVRWSSWSHGALMLCWACRRQDLLFAAEATNAAYSSCTVRRASSRLCDMGLDEAPTVRGGQIGVWRWRGGIRTAAAVCCRINAGLLARRGEPALWRPFPFSGLEDALQAPRSPLRVRSSAPLMAAAVSPWWSVSVEDPAVSAGTGGGKTRQLFPFLRLRLKTSSARIARSRSASRAICAARSCL